jgi:hypothetical protein
MSIDLFDHVWARTVSIQALKTRFPIVPPAHPRPTGTTSACRRVETANCRTSVREKFYVDDTSIGNGQHSDI